MIELLDELSFKNKVFNFELDEIDWINLSNTQICVSFYNSWCTLCPEIEAYLLQLQNKYQGKVKFYQINHQQSALLNKILKILSVPAFIFVPLKGEIQLLKGIFPLNVIDFSINDILIKE